MRTICSLLALVALAGCAAEPPGYARGRDIRSAEQEAQSCRAEVSRVAYGNRPVNPVGAPQVISRPGLRAVTLSVSSAPGAAPEVWHCLFNAPQGALLSVAPGEAQARGDYLY